MHSFRWSARRAHLVSKQPQALQSVGPHRGVATQAVQHCALVFMPSTSLMPRALLHQLSARSVSRGLYHQHITCPKPVRLAPGFTGRLPRVSSSELYCSELCRASFAAPRPTRHTSPLNFSGLVSLGIGAAMYIAPVRGLYSSHTRLDRPHYRDAPRPRVQVISTAALDPLLAPLGLPARHLASITQLGFWRLAGPAFAMAFGAAAQHLAASGTEREHGAYCAALAASHASAGASMNRPAFAYDAHHPATLPSMRICMAPRTRGRRFDSARCRECSPCRVGWSSSCVECWKGCSTHRRF